MDRGFTYYEQLALIVPQVQRIIPLARITYQLPSIDLNRVREYTPRGVDEIAAMLPLHQALRAGGVAGRGYGAVEGFLEVAVGGEGVGDAGVFGLEEVVVYGVVEALPIGFRKSARVSGVEEETYRPCEGA